jgi:antitoxin (DNA-binding transcriptional repressor) of toxin-antitoxin stability system
MQRPGDMREQGHTTETVSSSVAREGWSELLHRVHGGRTRVVVEERGIPVAAVISTQELDRLTELDAIERTGWEAIDALQERNAGLDPDDVLRDVTAEVEDVRRERYEREQASKSSR